MGPNDGIEVGADEIQVLVDQLAANPPDGKVRLIEAENGSLIAEWTSDGHPASVGATTTRQLP